VYNKPGRAVIMTKYGKPIAEVIPVNPVFDPEEK
jgi:antitoxin (DNA-binding transcriptional repressor) of toxin-antitoxin stability system